MKKENAEKILRIYNWIRFIIIVAFLVFLYVGLAHSRPSADNDFLSKEQVGDTIGNVAKVEQGESERME